MNAARSAMSSRRKWRALFFSSLAAFVLLCSWIALSLSSGSSPVLWLRSILSSSRADRGSAIVPISNYLEGGYGLRSIVPADNLASSINANGRRIVIGFAGPMDRDTSDILQGIDAYTEGEEAFDFRNFSWADEATFVVTLPRDLRPKEYLGLEFRFRKADGNPLPPIKLTYR